MRLLNGNLTLSPSDLAESLLCDHLVALELAKAAHPDYLKVESRDSVELLERRGNEHELAYLESLRKSGRTIAEITVDGYETSDIGAAAADTLDAMRSGVDVVYQATFLDGRWMGHADFLERIEQPSSLGAFSYEVVDTKLARHVKVEALVQISNYSEHVARLQGREPEQMHLVLGDGSRSTFLVRDFAAYHRSLKRHFEQIVGEISIEETYPSPVSHCALCDWSDQCALRRVTDDHLSLVAKMRSTQVEHLNHHGIMTLTDLGSGQGPQRVAHIGVKTLETLRDQARLQLKQRKTGMVHYELIEPREHSTDRRSFGLCSLPQPSPGDLFFDMEGDPYIGNHGLEYLFGVLEVVDGRREFRSFWGHDSAGEKVAFEQFIDFVIERLSHDPALHIYHYAPYEPTKLKQLAGRYGTREIELDKLLRGEVFVDLYRVVRQGVRVSQDSYSIKKLEPLYMDKRSTDVTSGSDSIVQYETWLQSRDQSILDDIEAYNRDDCESTLLLRNWLEERRLEAAALLGQTLPRPEHSEPTASERVSELDEVMSAIDAELRVEVPSTEATPEQQAQHLLAHLLEWHRREAKADWWRHYELIDMDDDELFDDREALAGLTYEGVVDQVKQSLVHRYRFDPSQDHKIVVSSEAIDPRTMKSAGAVVDIDSEIGLIDLKRGKRSEAPHPYSLIPPGPIDASAQQQALIDVGQWVVDRDIDAPGRFRCVRDLLLRRTPRLSSGSSVSEVINAADTTTAGACRLAAELDDGLLALQGPPGSGKTYTGAEMIVELVQSGKRVGITATSHKVVGNLLDAVATHAARKGVDVRIVQKSDKNGHCTSPFGECALSNEAIETAVAGGVDIVGGTPWLFARQQMRERFDVLFVDEAGQMSLADVVAVGTSAKSLVLLGDPQQLAQPSKGVHPDGAGASALGHFLADHQTMPADQGLLLDQTWRMHSEICEFVSQSFYESRLESEPTCDRQRVVTRDGTSSVGLRYIPVEHVNNQTSSREEAEVIREQIGYLLDSRWTDREGVERALTLEDILVVAPYNAQVLRLKDTLPQGTRVGTVDKFQGQEAAVVFYSLASSSPDDISRGMEFLFSNHRLNVAVSRARCLAFLVCSPRLLTVGCDTPAQARLANGMCRFVECSTTVVAQPSSDVLMVASRSHQMVSARPQPGSSDANN